MPRYCFSKDKSGYFLKDCLGNQRPLRIYFSAPNLRRRAAQTGKSELLLKAIGAQNNLRVLDCTAGLGVDAYLMAAYGCHVTMLEQSPVLGLMLREALIRALLDPDASVIAERMRLQETNAVDFLNSYCRQTEDDGAKLAHSFEVIYIDPMFPPRSKSAEVKGGMQILQKFIGKTDNVKLLLEKAVATGIKRVVIKRPLRGGDIDGFTPSYQQKAKASRFDVYLQ